MTWRGPFAMFVAASLAALIHGVPDAGTFATLTATDAASGIVRAGVWAAPSPSTRPTGTPRPPDPTPGPTPSATPNPCIGGPPFFADLCIRVPTRGTSGSTLPPLPTSTPASATR